MGQHCRDLRDSTELVVSVMYRKQGSFQHWGVQIHYLHDSLHDAVSTGDVESSFVWFNGVHYWDCNLGFAIQGEITIKVKSAENSQVICN